MFAGAGRNTVSKLKDIWKARQQAKSVAEEAFKHIDDATRVGHTLGRQVDALSNRAIASLDRAKGQLTSFISQFPEEAAPVRNLIAKLDEAERLARLNPDQAIAVVDDVLKTIRDTNVDAFVANLVESGKIPKGMASRFRIELGRGIEEVATSVSTSKSSLDNAARLVREIGAARSTKGNAGFIEEYLRYSKSPHSPEAQRWLANPANVDRMLKLRESGRAAKIISELERSGRVSVPVMTKLKGVTYTDLAKRMGLGGAVGLGAGGLGVAKLYDWMGDVGDFSLSGPPIETTMSNLQQKTSGPGASVVQEANRALGVINQSALRSKQMMDRDPQTAIANMTREFGQQHMRLLQVLNNWDKVTANTTDPEAAEQAQDQLAGFVNNIGAKLKQLGVTVNVPIKRESDPLEDYANISQIQRYFGVRPTGKMDPSTASKLRALEAKLNEKARDMGANRDFSGFFYNPTVGHVIPYPDLLESIKRLN